jgi:putative transposase
VLEVLRSERFVDCSPGTGLGDAARRGPLPLLGAHDVPAARRAPGGAGAARSAHASRYAKPELLAERPNQLWSWDITKLLGPTKWSYYYLYVILDVFSRYVVGWTVQHQGVGCRWPSS